eukprot:3473067-Amphidinium_carterae.1
MVSCQGDAIGATDLIPIPAPNTVARITAPQHAGPKGGADSHLSTTDEMLITLRSTLLRCLSSSSNSLHALKALMRLSATTS